MYKSTQKYNYPNMKDQTGSTNSMEIVQGNLLSGEFSAEQANQDLVKIKNLILPT